MIILISAVLLAAGKSTRMPPCKQLSEIHGLTMIEHVLRSIQESKVDEIIVVLGFMADEILKRVPMKGVRTVLNPRYEEGQSTSLKAGLKAVNKKAEAVIFFLCDQPFVEASVINKIISQYEKNRAPTLVPTYKGKRGNPVLVDRSLFDEIMSISGDTGAKPVIMRHDRAVREVEVDSPSVLLDIDTMEDLEEFKKRWYG